MVLTPPPRVVFYDFNCPRCGPITRRVALGESRTVCPGCGGDATRVYSTSFTVVNHPTISEAVEWYDKTEEAERIREYNAGTH